MFSIHGLWLLHILTNCIFIRLHRRIQFLLRIFNFFSYLNRRSLFLLKLGMKIIRYAFCCILLHSNSNQLAELLIRLFQSIDNIKTISVSSEICNVLYSIHNITNEHIHRFADILFYIAVLACILCCIITILTFYCCNFFVLF